MKPSFYLLCLIPFLSFAQQHTNVTVNFNVNHIVGGIGAFDRSKFITIHANQIENEWDGDNFTDDLRKDFLEGYDVYLGRDTGGITWNLNYMEEDPVRPGYADPARIAVKGKNSRNNYASKTHLHKYENRKNHVVGAQLHPFWTGESQRATSKTGWKLASPTATGEYMGRYFNEFHGQNGQPLPTWVEIINEPAYEALGGKSNYTNSLQEIADFHVEVADAIKEQNPNLKVGGYTVAFPDFETGDFQRWTNRDKLFIDVAGEKMDFWSWHLYDFPAIGGRVDLRSGSNVEATFDMHDQYSMLALGHTKPYVISEYGAQTHDYNNRPWTPYRDWLFLRAQNSLMMSFMERPDAIAIAIPFTIVKAEWGFNHDKNLPYGSRLMRKSNEPDSYTGEWVYTERVKFYQLWKNVKGKRVDSFASDLDVQVDAYVDGKNAYVILNNLEFQDKTIQLNLLDVYGNQLSKVLQKHLTIAGTNPVLIEKELPLPVSQITLGPGATMILECAFNNEVIIDETSKETKFYADRYLQPIVANQTNEFQIHHVTKTSEFGEGVLRISIGRDHGAELIPTVIMNGVALKVPEDYRGYNQADKKRFFGTLEIPVPYHLIQESNNITVQYPDNGGHISSVILQAFDFSANIRAIDLANLPLNNYQIKTTTPSCSDESDGVIEINTQVAVPYQAIFKENGEERVKVFNSQLKIENLAAGEYELVLAPKDLLTHQSVFKIRIHEAKGLSIKSTVNQLQNKMQLSLEGAERYWIKLNGKEHAYTSNKIELNLLRGLNTLEVRSDKPCQGTYKKEVYAGQEYVISRTSNNRLNVRLNPNRVPSTLTFFNVMGQQIKQTLMTGSEISLQTSDLTSGIYFLIFQQQNQVYAKTKWFVP